MLRTARLWCAITWLISGLLVARAGAQDGPVPGWIPGIQPPGTPIPPPSYGCPCNCPQPPITYEDMYFCDVGSCEWVGHVTEASLLEWLGDHCIDLSHHDPPDACDWSCIGAQLAYRTRLCQCEAYVDWGHDPELQSPPPSLCDVDGDGDVDCNDLNAFLAGIGEPCVERSQILGLICCFLSHIQTPPPDGCGETWGTSPATACDELRVCLEGIHLVDGNPSEQRFYPPLNPGEIDELLICYGCDCCVTASATACSDAGARAIYFDCGSTPCDRTGDGLVNCDDFLDFVAAASSSCMPEGQAEWNDSQLLELACAFLAKYVGGTEAGHCAASPEEACELARAIVACLQELLCRPLTAAEMACLEACAGEGCDLGDCCQEIAASEAWGDPGTGTAKYAACADAILCDRDCDGAVNCADLQLFVVESVVSCPGAAVTREQLLLIACAYMQQCASEDLCGQLPACLDGLMDLFGGEPLTEGEWAQVSMCAPECAACAVEDSGAEPDELPCPTCPGGDDESSLPETPEGVRLPTGDSMSSQTDLAGQVPGSDALLSRDYTSSTDYDSSCAVGENWSLSSFHTAVESGTSDGPATLMLKLGARRQVGIDIEAASKIVDAHGLEFWRVPGPTSLIVYRDEVGIPGVGTNVPVWRVQSPGGSSTDYFRANTTGSSTASPIPPEFVGRIARIADAYETNRQYFNWGLWFGMAGTRVARLHSISVNPDPATGAPEASITFSYRVASDPNFGRVGMATLVRFDASGFPVPVQRVEYKYYGDTDVPVNTDLGSLGDLVLVIHSERVDPAPGSSAATWRRVVTHYRYHRTEAIEEPGELVDFSGFTHQLKMVVSPEQVEYATVQAASAASGTGPVTVESWASDLLTATDEQALWSGGESPYTLSSRVYERYEVGFGTGKVLLVRTNAGCGCSGGTGLRTFSYNYVADNSTRSTTYVDEAPNATSTGQRRHWYETYAPGGAGAQHLRARAIQELDASGSTVSPTRRGWVTALEHDPVGRRLTLKRTPSTFPQGIALPGDALGATSSFDYRPGTLSDPPVFDTSPTVGRTERFDYPDASAVAAEPYLFNLPIATYVGQGASPSGSGWDLVQSTSYGDADGSSSQWTTGNSRPWLPSRIQRYRTDAGTPAADDIEESRFFYGFVSGDQIAWSTSSVEADLESENGPSTGGLWYSSHTLYDTRGQVIWTIGADGAATNYSYSAPTGDFAAPTGLPTSVTENASTSGLPATYYGLTTSAFGPHSADGSLTTRFQRDLSGRVQATTLPGGVTHYVIRTMAEHPFRPRVPHYVEFVLPHQWPGEPVEGVAPWIHDGPASETWYTASNSPLSTSEFSVVGTDYKFASRGNGWQVVINEFSLLQETGRTYTSYLHNGTVDWSAYWTAFATGSIEAPFGGVHYSQYQYDELGRVKRFAAANGTVTTYGYDILDRVISVGVGVIDQSTSTFYEETSGYSYVSTAEYAYDEDGALDIGNGYLSTQSSFAEGVARVTKYFHDWRDRLVFTLNPAAPHSFSLYDNLDRIVETGLLAGAPSGTSSGNHQNVAALGASDASLRTTLTRTNFSQRGLAYRERTAIDPTLAEGSLTFLDYHRWFDEEARVVGRWSGTGPMMKISRDGLGRFVTIHSSDRGGDPAPGAAGNYDDVFNPSSRKADLTGDIVVEETANDFDAPSGVPNLVITRRRSHDAPTSATGSLALSGNLQYAVTTFAGSILDGAKRPVKRIDYGTNLSADSLQANGATPDLNASLAGFERVEETRYDDLGRIDSTVGPTGTVTKYLYDAADRTIATIENYSAADPVVVQWEVVDGIFAAQSGVDPATPDVNRVTTTTFNGSGDAIAVATFNSADGINGDRQITRYHYGVRVTTSTGAEASLVDSNDLLSFVEYPGSGSGAGGGGGGGGGSGSLPPHYEATSFNEQGEPRYVEEGMGAGPIWFDTGSVHSSKRELLRDGVGRVVADHVLAVGSDIDDTVDALVYEYDVQARRVRATSYDGFTSLSSPGTAVNDIEMVHDSLWRLSHLDQNPVGALTYSGGAPSGNTRRVSYTYDTQHSGSSTPNYARLSQLQYPDGSTLSYQYGLTSTSLDRRISRPTSLSLGSGRVVAYDRIGLSVPVVVDFPVPDIQLDRYRSEGGATSTAVYPGLDRFGRVKRQMWVDGSFTTGSGGNPNIPPLVETSHSYSVDNNRLTGIDDRPGAAQPLSHEYAYDGLHRLKEAKRGVAASGAVPVGKGSQRWYDDSGTLTLDALGNWREAWTDRDGDGTYGTTSELNTLEVDRREHDGLNRATSRELSNVSGTPTTLALADPTHDLASNLKSQDVQVPASATTTSITYRHDAWNRLLDVSFGGTARAKYRYNALHSRVVKMADVFGAGTGPTAGPDGTIDQIRLMYYDGDWRLLEERIDESAVAAVVGGNWSSLNLDRHQQYVWGLRGIDDIILHRVDRNRNGSYTDGSDGTWYHLTDVQGSTVCLTDSSAHVVERVTYSAYGLARHHWAYDVDGDGDVDTTSDRAIINAIIGLPLASRTIGGSAYRSEADLNRDGVVNSSDRSLITTAVGARAEGQITDISSTGPDNTVGWDGYLFNADTALYTVRFRHYDPGLGRWLERDPAGYINGTNLYGYCGGLPIGRIDPHGLAWLWIIPTWQELKDGANALFSDTAGDLRPWQESSESMRNRYKEKAKNECDPAKREVLEHAIDQIEEGIKAVENALIDLDQAKADFIVAAVTAPMGGAGVLVTVVFQGQQIVIDISQGQTGEAVGRVVGLGIQGAGVGAGKLIGRLLSPQASAAIQKAAAAKAAAGTADDVAKAATGAATKPVTSAAGAASECCAVARGAKAPAARSVNDLIQEVANRAERWGARQGLRAKGGGAFQGTKKHDYAKRLLDKYQKIIKDEGLQLEKSYTNGVVAGGKGSIRLDVCKPSTGEIWDYKFFDGAVFSGRRMGQFFQHGPRAPGGGAPIVHPPVIPQ